MIKIEILSARNPKWVGEDGRAINCLVKTNTLVEEVPFTASMDDVEPHGRELFARCVAGEFGEIAPVEPLKFTGSRSTYELDPEHQRLERFLFEVNQENARKSCRGVAIVWASILDNLLDELLELHAARLTTAGGQAGRPPNAFDARIRLANQMGLISEVQAEKYQHVRRIRNAAAHEWQFSLQGKGVLGGLRALYQADHSRVFVFHEDLDYLIRQIYSSSCAMLAMSLMSSVATLSK
ncbi:hypothetical protein MXD81_52845 [Microbacteriaceae bacterium K1510]|nr:hypothetical protein [Microbacteriaceae bacterium K1510]